MKFQNNWQGTAEMIRRAGSARGRRQTGLYSIEGLRLVERAWRAGAPLAAVLAAESFLTDPAPRIRELLAGLEAVCPVVAAPDAAVAELTEGRDLGAVLGLVRLQERPSLVDMAAAVHPRRPCFPAAVNIIDPGNVGALARTAHAAGAAGLLTAGQSDAFHPRAARTSRGSIFKLPVRHYDTIETLLADLKAHELAIVATAAGGGAALPDVVWPAGGLAVLMGNEAGGLPEPILATANCIVTIPMADGVDSFAVNAAAAVILYSILIERPFRAGTKS